MEPCCSRQVPPPKLRPRAELAHQHTVGDGGKVARRPVSRDVATHRRTWPSSERHWLRVTCFKKCARFRNSVVKNDFHIIQTIEIPPFQPGKTRAKHGVH